MVFYRHQDCLLTFSNMGVVTIQTINCSSCHLLDFKKQDHALQVHILNSFHLIPYQWQLEAKQCGHSEWLKIQMELGLCTIPWVMVYIVDHIIGLSMISHIVHMPTLLTKIIVVCVNTSNSANNFDRCIVVSLGNYLIQLATIINVDQRISSYQVSDLQLSCKS